MAYRELTLIGTEPLRIHRDTLPDQYVSFLVGATGDLTITPVGADTVITGTLTVSSTLAGQARINLNSAAGPSLSQSNLKLNFTGQATAVDGLYMGNTTGTFVVGIEGSAGAALVGSGSAYAAVIATVGATSLQLGTNNTLRCTITSAGLTNFTGNVGVAGGSADAAVGLRIGSTITSATVSYGALADNTFTLDASRTEINGWQQGANAIATTGSNFNLTGNYHAIRVSSATKTGGGTVTMVHSIRLFPQTIGTNNSALTINTGWTAPAAAADQIRTWASDIAAGDARLGVQSESGSAIYIGNDRLRFAATTGIIDVAGTSVISATTTAVTIPSLAGSGTRTVVVDANGVMSAP